MEKCIGVSRVRTSAKTSDHGNYDRCIAHEFNNFLTPIMGYAELLMMELPEGSEEQDSAKEIYEASEKAKDVVRQISSLSRKS